jgi:mono/diheme cytochrome c family protein
MKIIQQISIAAVAGILISALPSCQQAGKNSTGSEFIPDMAHSIAYEANVLTKYSLNTWDKESKLSRRELSEPKLPVNGTIPRGFARVAVNAGSFGSAEEAVLYTMEQSKLEKGFSYTQNSSAPYYFPDTEEGRTAATAQLKYNPYPITADGLARGKELYDIFCGICHGEKGDGAGYLVRDNGGKYPAQPANLLDSQYLWSPNGRYYHALIYGKNAMGGYADKLSYEERWQVIHYVRSLQAASKNVKYDAQVNELKSEFGLPETQANKLAAARQAPAPVAESAESQSDGHEGSH